MAMQPHLLVDEGDLNDIALIPGDPGAWTESRRSVTPRRSSPRTASTRSSTRSTRGRR
ncbi:hypothetical protein [Haladaptatus sp. W1]|uniref:hypothetical protein n=1 Tax=Haladaptatus sp. W1 TaxID=1897478 RepID=UPI00373FDA7C